MTTDEFQLDYQRSRLIRTSQRSLAQLLQSPPWADLVRVDTTGVDPDAADMRIGSRGVREPRLPALIIRGSLIGFPARLAAALPGFLAYRQQVLRRAAALAMTHHADFLAERGPQGDPPDDATCRREVGETLDDLDIYLTNKVIDTPRGRLDFRSLFRHPVVEHGASRLVKETIAALIAAEDPAAPLSDDAIVALLAERDIIVSWLPEEEHPIASYRRVLGLPPADERKVTAVRGSPR